jgi:thiol:disulfide interchange protein
MPQAPDAAGGTRNTPRLLLSIAGVLLLLRIAVGVYEVRRPPDLADRVTWHSIENAQGLAAATSKPILYDFTADWCPPCRLMTREVFSDPGRAQRINLMFVPVQVLDRSREEGHNSPEVAELQSRYRIDGFPTLIVVRPTGDPDVLSGYPGTEETMRWLIAASSGARFRPPGRDSISSVKTR